MKTGQVLTKREDLNACGLSKQINHVPSMNDEPKISIQGFLYLVDFGADSVQRYHRVNKSRECSCGSAYCKAIDAVRLYLQAGGVRAPDPEEMPPCPICGSKTYRDRNWDGKYTKELGWRCTKGGLHHFLQNKTERIKKNFAENPWLIPPAPGYNAGTAA